MSKSSVFALFFAASLALAGCMDKVTEHRVRGNAHAREGDYAGAIAEYDQGLAANPNDAATLILKANALYELGRYDEAYDTYSKANQVDPSTPDAVKGMALVAAARGDLDEAAKLFEKLLTVKGHEHDSAMRINLANVYFAQGKLDLAEKQAVEAGHENGNDEGVLFPLGRIYLAEGKLDEATATFRHLVDSNPKAASGPYGLALVAAKRGDKAEMIKQLKDAMGKGVHDPKAVAKDPAFTAFKDDPDFVAIATVK